MNPITQELADQVAELDAAGIPATRDPGDVVTMLATAPAVALVTYDETVRLSVGAAGIQLDVGVWLVTAPPLDAAAVERLHDALIPAARAALPLEDITRDRFDIGDGELPAYRWTTGRSLPYPTS